MTQPFDIEAMRKDMEAGSQGNWAAYEKGRLLRVEALRGGPTCVAGIHKIGSKGGRGQGCYYANARRIARVPAMEAEILRLTAEVERLRGLLRLWRNSGCPECGGDCSSANVPVAFCIMAETRAAIGDAP